MGNTLKTTVLLAALTGLFLLIGDAFGGERGMIMALAFAAITNVGAYWFSDKIVLAMYGAREVSPAEAPELHQVVDNLAMKAGIPKPKVYIIPTDAPNAFATGRDPHHAAVAATEGILGILNHDELEAVLAHELGHVRNRDILISTIAATVAGAISMVARLAFWFGGFGRDRDREGNGLVLLLTMILAPIIALIIQLAISRSREYAADASGAKLSGHPLALASALAKLQRGAQVRPMEDATPATAHMFIVNPLTGGWARSLFSTHPPTEERIKRLEAMAGQLGPRMAPPDRYYYNM